MTTYRIVAPHFCAAVVVEEGTVLQAAPILRWAVAGRWETLRDHCQDKGWIIEPLPVSVHTEWIDQGDVLYELHWVGNRCVRITKHEEGLEEDVAFGDLPDEVARLVE